MLQYPVYLAERNATRALIDYYHVAINGSFEKTIEAVIKFARTDAARFRLRDSLRSQALAVLLGKYRSSYIEAGVIHYQICRLLRHRLPKSNRIRPIFLANLALKELRESGHQYGPGDQLTLLFIFHPDISPTDRLQQLAARSIIYSKIIEKAEGTVDCRTYPHLRDELACIRSTKLLSMDDCRKLFSLIRQTGTVEARQIVNDYLVEKGKRPLLS
jgi:hypothetical protein